VPDSTWTPTGGNVVFSDGGTITTASVAGGLVNVSFTCLPGTSVNTDGMSSGGVQTQPPPSDPNSCLTDPIYDCHSRVESPAAGFVINAEGGTPSSSTTSTSTSSTAPASTTTTEATTAVGSGTSNFTMSCTNNVNSEVSTMNWTARGTSLSSFNPGDTVPLRNQRWNLTIGGSIFDTGMNLNLINPGDSVQSHVDVTVNATNTSEGSRTSKDIPFTVAVEVDDSGAAKDATASFFVPDSTWTASGGPIVWTPASSEIRVTIPNIALPVIFECDADAGTAPILDTSAPQVLGESLAFTGGRGGGPLLPIAMSLILLDLGYMAWSATRPDRRKFV